jgi:thioester reductase-like protein
MLDLETSFFNLRGHSVLLLTVQSAINRKFKIKIPRRDILDKPTPSRTMEHICTLKGIPFKSPCKSISSTGITTPIIPSAMCSEVPLHIASGSTSPGGLTPVMEEIKISKEMLKEHLSGTKAVFQIDWDEENLLPVEDRYHIPAGGEYPAEQQTTGIFITGVNTFVRIYFLAEVLARSNVKVHIIGTSSHIRHVNAIKHLQKYRLLRDSVSSGTVWARVRCYHGDMTQPHFGLTTLEFHRLGHRVQAIYNLGVCVSLIQKYSNLRAVNTRAILDIVELAACGPHISTILHLSTFSVPHLQSWSQSVRMQDSYSLTETAPTNYQPSTSDDHGYIKARWAAEMLLTNAADRGFPTRIYQASLPTTSTRTHIPPAEHGIIKQIVTLILRTGYVPKPRPGQPDMAVDLVPVDVLVSWLYLLSTMPPETDRLRIHHLTNPRPVPFTQLVEIIPTLANGPGRGELLNLETWLERAGKVCGASERRTY